MDHWICLTSNWSRWQAASRSLWRQEDDWGRTELSGPREGTPHHQGNTSYLTIRLTNGVTTVCEQTGAFELKIQGYRSWTTLRILDWESYDIILGMDWLKQSHAVWDFTQSALTILNGGKKASRIRMKKHFDLTFDGCAELGLNVISYRDARHAITKRQATAVLYVVRDKQKLISKPRAVITITGEPIPNHVTDGDNKLD